jgi:hypothetical protein
MIVAAVARGCARVRVLQGGQRRAEMEKQKRVEHIANISMRRLGKHALSRGWVKWAAVHAASAQRARLAMQRFKSRGQWMAFEQWRRAHPPRSFVSPEDLAAVQRALEAECAAHEKTRTYIDRLRADQKAMIQTLEAEQGHQTELRAVSACLEVSDERSHAPRVCATHDVCMRCRQQQL